MKTLSSGTVLAALLAALAPGCNDADTPRPPTFTDLGGSLGETFAPLDGGAGDEDAVPSPDGSPSDSPRADGSVNPNPDDLGGPVQPDGGVVAPADNGGPAPTDNGVVPTEDLGGPFADGGVGPTDLGGGVGPTDNGVVVGPADLGPSGPADNGAVVGPADLGPSGPADNGAVIGPADLGP
jgi:hypothetical protein